MKWLGSTRLPYFIVLIITLLLSESAIAQSNLLADVRLRIRRGNVEGSNVVVYRNGSRVSTIPIGRSGRLEVNLEYDSDYILSFEKDNHVTKKININTKVPSDFNRNRMNFIPFEVELEPQTDLSAIKVYDNPVGRIRYDARKGDFDYDTDYSASFQKQVREEERKLAEEVTKAWQR